MQADACAAQFCTGLALCFELQGIVQFVPLTLTLLGQLTSDLLVIPHNLRYELHLADANAAQICKLFMSL